MSSSFHHRMKHRLLQRQQQQQQHHHHHRQWELLGHLNVNGGDGGDDYEISKQVKNKRFYSKFFSSSSSLQQSSTSHENNNNDDAPTSNLVKGRTLLVIVSILYGTLNIALRALYNLPNPPSASTLSASRGWIASFCFIPFLLTSPPSPKSISTTSSNGEEENGKDAIVTSATSDEKKKKQQQQNKKDMWIAAFELALYNLGAQGLLNIGLLKISSSARASFLTQTSVIFTPLLSIFFGDVVNRNVWSGCIAALAGLILHSSSGGGETAAAGGGGGGGFLSSFMSASFGEGDAFVLGGALSWSIYLYRTSKVGDLYPEIQLQSIKTFLLAILYTIWFLFASFSGGNGEFVNLWIGWKNITAWMILAYSAIGPGAAADILQQQGQKEVSASEANIILSLEPVFTALLAMGILGEVTSLRENVGGALIFLAAILASRE